MAPDLVGRESSPEMKTRAEQRRVARSWGRSLAVALAISAGACASDSSESVQRELGQAAQRAEAGVAKISRALAEPEAGPRGFGEGVSQVELATRTLAELEGDERASDVQRLMAVLLQARAWDDATRAIEGAAMPSAFDAEQQSLYAGVLQEKAFPSRVAAQNSWERARKLACGLGADEPLLLEIADGVSRYGGRSLSLEDACKDP